MPIYYGGSKIKEIYKDGTFITRAYNGSSIVFGYNPEEVVFESNVPITAEVFLTPGIYEITIVGGGGGSSGSGGGGGAADESTGTAYPKGGS